MSDTLTGTNYPGILIRKYFANGKGNSILLNQSFDVMISYVGKADPHGYPLLDENGVPVKVPQIDVELHVRTASDLDPDTPFFSDIIIPSVDPNIGSFLGQFPVEETNKITSANVAITIALVTSGQPKIMDACILRVAGSV